jgi:hypothetical protein
MQFKQNNKREKQKQTEKEKAKAVPQHTNEGAWVERKYSSYSF